MTEHPEPSELLTSTPTEMEASIIVAALEEEGIHSTTTGEYTAELRVGVPGWVQILVRDEDLARAQEVLEQVKDDNDHIDWSRIDVGEPEDDS
ncbi:MAG: DUF2007 domain-containing protein [Planctomycetes bacterium]|nr:DUF2007 domain-containing protein [Planctomycetota bacterium]